MKFALALLALVATTSAKIEIPNFGRGELYKDIQEFLDLLPVEEMLSVCVEYISEDAEVQRYFEYLQGPEFKKLVGDVEGMKEIKVLMDYIHNAGIDIYKMINMLNDLLGLPHLTPPDNFVQRNYKTGTGVRGLLDDIEKLVPVDEIKALHEKKMKESKAYKEFIDQLSSPNFQEIVNKVYANPTFQKMLTEAKKAGVDLKLVKDILETIFGIHVPDSR